jgi:hypothetical protein
MKCFVAAEEDLVMLRWLEDPASVIPLSRPLYREVQMQEPSPSQTPPSQGEEQKLTN